ncbi:MAG: acetyl-CoA carboxylase carboxyltransferase subunit alpha [Pelagibacteraceae bacterium]|mgnify:FL=1|jgi:acetyl-CoA carboxylase carboxyl transferase subunit alpha|nr:acetyl-CoA carboxylase carboxyltransferase subunit alpha [Pelagibacteraceae bacterium]HJO13504.1 acetyl-CoA carboxylase carboxyltransferase subunit alpha [Alphaproteobacteria bacterium]MBO6466835.1 acetyl-CoA carboxylase carboxyltransferase subunit alpha [Pelagibacteraceae bacterium]MBO6467147.1 acetyl-CoA carboxylase carboxyltransferase subunit alpha [Pelagibacteraceae bacterium]MBO6470063.1 acetyl-CoA carboxylase carboxyltransferase subunit alpha [Pelagibacteraceae bacterium]|tara:strand:+ start:1838 stop:2776 length:939 start_codon:yes stop_codon:yes gene_type:complete
MNKYFDFEKPIEIIDDKIKALESNNEDNNLDLIQKYNLEKKNLLKKIYSSLTSWQKVKIARHSDRPHTLDYIENMFSNFIPLSGDKKFAEDRAIVGGLAKIDGLSVMIIGNEKGNSMEKRIEHNFGMAKPEGFRKAQRLMVLAEKLKLPVVTFVDTAGAFPGKEAEERGQSESIASSIAQCLKVRTPIISIIIGEGGSGGAIALATADRVLMLENSIFSVISPEGCASILWRNTEAVQKAAKSLKLTAEDCLELNVIDGIIEEMIGGAHRYPKEQFVTVKKTIIENLEKLIKLPVEKIVADRNEKFLNITLN